MLNERNTLLEDDGIEEEILVEEECSVAQAVWGDIGGNIENQTDLQNALDAKQDSLTEAQLNAVNSGITPEKVTTYDGYADQIASKADQSALNAEATTRGEADTALGTRIDNEALARQSADNGLQSQIDAITSRSDVVDVVANYAALQAYDTSTLSDKDVVKVLDDETHEDALTYYRWSTTTQTWSYIGQEAPYYSKGQMDVKLAEKQDKLTAGANIQIQNGTISATDTTYTAGNGLNLNGTEFSADTDVLATKSDLEGYYTKPETDNLLAPKLEAEVVAELPTTGTEGKLYLTPKAHTTQTETGNPITATVAEEAGAIESFQLDGDTYQQSYEGKNLLMNKESAQEKTGITITPNSDGSFTLDGTATAPTDFYFAGSWQNRTISYLDMPSGDYTISLLDSTKQQIASPKFRVELYDRMGENSSRILWLQQSLASPQTTNVASSAQVTAYYIAIQNGTSFSNEKFYIQLEKGSTATSFEKFVGGVPAPNPDYPQPIQTVTGLQTVEIVGKNLFDKNDVVNGIPANTDGSIVSTTSVGRTSDFITVMPNTAYSHTGHPLGWANVAWYRADKSFIRRDADATTATSPSEAAYARVSCAQGNLGTCQFEIGQPTDYAPYSKQTLPLDLGSIELFSSSSDYIHKDGDNWKVHKGTGKVTLDGSESWTKASANSGYRFWTGKAADIKTSIDAVLKANRLGVAQGDTWDNYGISGSYSFNPIRLYIRDALFNDMTAEQLRSWLATHNIIAYYTLATPTDTTITDTALIAQLEAIRTASLQNGANTITNTATGSNLAGDMKIGYYGFAPRNRYDKWLWLDINNEYEQIGS